MSQDKPVIFSLVPEIQEDLSREFSSGNPGIHHYSPLLPKFYGQNLDDRDEFDQISTLNG